MKQAATTAAIGLDQAVRGNHFVATRSGDSWRWVKRIEHPDSSPVRVYGSHVAVDSNCSVVVAGNLRAPFVLDGHSLTPIDQDFYVTRLILTTD